MATHSSIFLQAIRELQTAHGVIYPMVAVQALAAPNFWRVYDAVNGGDGEDIYCARPGISLEECKAWLSEAVPVASGYSGWSWVIYRRDNIEHVLLYSREDTYNITVEIHKGLRTCSALTWDMQLQRYRGMEIEGAGGPSVLVEEYVRRALPFPRLISQTRKLLEEVDRYRMFGALRRQVLCIKRGFVSGERSDDEIIGFYELFNPLMTRVTSIAEERKAARAREIPDVDSWKVAMAALCAEIKEEIVIGLPWSQRQEIIYYYRANILCNRINDLEHDEDVTMDSLCERVDIQSALWEEFAKYSSPELQSANYYCHCDGHYLSFDERYDRIEDIDWGLSYASLEGCQHCREHAY
jgi:hypothetical protein